MIVLQMLQFIEPLGWLNLREHRHAGIRLMLSTRSKFSRLNVDKFQRFANNFASAAHVRWNNTLEILLLARNKFADE